MKQRIIGDNEAMKEETLNDIKDVKKKDGRKEGRNKHT